MSDPAKQPTADEFFGGGQEPHGLPTAAEFFAPPQPSGWQRAANVAADLATYSPNSSADMAAFIQKTPVGRVLDAFGQGAREAWGSEPVGLSDETSDFLGKAGLLPDYSKNRRNFFTNFNEALIRPAAAAIDAANRGAGAIIAGGEHALYQTGIETDQKEAGETAAGMLEWATQRGDIALHPLAPGQGPLDLAVQHPMDIPRYLAKARGLGVIGEGEGGFQDTKAPTLETVTQRADAIKTEAQHAADAAKEIGAPEPTAGAPKETPVAVPASAPPPPDIDTIARQVAPQAFQQRDSLLTRQQTYRTWLYELGDERANLPEARDLQSQIETILGKVNGVEDRLTKVKAARLSAARDRLEEIMRTDTPDMAFVREKLIEATHGLWDVAPDVRAAYARAQEQLPPEAFAEGHRGPQPEVPPPTAAPLETQTAPPVAEPAEQAPQDAVQPVSGGPAPQTAAVPQVPPGRPAAVTAEAAQPSIANDVARKLVFAGRPQEEADAAGALVQAHYEARAARFGGALGTAQELYAREGPAIRRGRGAAPRPMPPEGESAVSPAPKPAEPTKAPSELESLDPTQIQVDPARFQFKGETGERGLSDRLQGVEQWDPRMAGTALVWRDKTGQDWIADGHQRLGLAQRLTEAGQTGIRLNAFVLNAAEGVTDADARAIAAAKNIAEGTGTAIDAAKVIREAKAKGIDLPPLPPRSALVRDGHALGRLSPEAFGMAVNDVVPTNQAAIVGRLVDDPLAQTEAMRVLAKAKPENVRQAELIVRDMLASGVEEMTKQGGLFGEEHFASSVVLERAKVADEAAKQLKRDKATFGVLVREAERIEGHGQNVLDPEANKGRLTTDEQASQFLTQLATRKGPVSEALSGIARRVKSGEITNAAGGREFLGIVRAEAEKGLATGPDLGGAEPRAEQDAELFQSGLKQEDLPGFENETPTERKARLGRQLIEESRQLPRAVSGKAQKPMEEGLFGSDEKAQRTLFQSKPKSLEIGAALAEAAAKSLPMDEDARLARAKAQGFHTQMPLYHGTDADFTEFRLAKGGSKSGSAAGRTGVFVSLDPADASRFAEMAASKETGTPLVMPLLHRAKKAAVLHLEGGERDLEVAATLADAFDNGYDAVLLRNYTTPWGETGKDILAVKDPSQLRSVHAAFDPERAGSPNLLAQGKRGAIAFRNARAEIRLFADADASTFIHETGHQWLEELMRDAADERAPEDVRADARTVHAWLGTKAGEAIPTAAHERFARGFERYVMEGAAPSRALASVFAKFKNWLTQIYQTVTRLKSPINDDIRGVFDRLLAQKPERATIAAERVPERTLADLHEEDAERTPPEHAATMADVIRGEIDNRAKEVAPEVHNELPAKAEAGGIQRENAPVPGRGHEAGAIVGESAGAPGTGAEPAGGNPIAAEGARPRGGASGAGVETPAGANSAFREPESDLTDKAGNIRVDNLNTTQDVDRLIHEVSDENGGFAGVRVPMSDAEALGLADAMGLRPEDLNGSQLANFSRAHAFAVRKLFVSVATAARDAAVKAATGSDADLLAYAAARSRMRMVQEHLSALTYAAGSVLRGFQRLPGTEEAKGLAQMMGNLSEQRTLFQMKQEAKRVANLDTPAKVSKYLRDADTPGLGEMALELFISNLISGPITHLTYMTGNTLLALWKAVPETAAEATIGAIREAFGGSEVERARMGEVGAQIYAMFGKGQRDGFRALWDAIKSGQTTALPGEMEAATGDLFSADNTRPTTPFTSSKAIPNFEVAGVPIPLGSIVRAPGERVVAPIHSYYRTVGYVQGIAREAYRKAYNEGLRGDALSSRIADLSKNPTPDMMETARHEATDQTLMGQGGELMRRVSTLLNYRFNLPLLGQTRLFRFIDPFVQVFGSIMREAVIKRGLPGLLSEDMRGRNGALAQNRAAARVAMGVGLSAVGAGLAAEGIIMGSAPADPRARGIWTLVNGLPHSVRIGDMSYDMSRLGVLGVHLGIAADLYGIAQAAAHGDVTNAASLVVHSIAQNFLDEGFAKGISDMLKAVDDSDRYGKEWLQNFAKSFVPYSVGLAQIARQIDPYARQARSVTDGIIAGIPFASESLEPRRDVWGEPVQNRDWALVYSQRIHADPVNQELLNLGVFPSQPQRKIRGVAITDAQYDDLSRIGGRYAKTLLDNDVRTPGWGSIPAEQRIEIIKTDIEAARETARTTVMMNDYASAPAGKSIIDRATALKTGPLH